jgi:2,4-dienoyl-CoA reductase-like NADH-dependent reductase (Old Yellow Enzyme family)
MKNIFDPGIIGSMKTINRFVRSATAEFGANIDGTITKDYLKLYSDLGMGNIGLIIQGHVYISDEGKAHDKMAGIAHDFHLPGLKDITTTVHEIDNNNKILAQLNHGGAYSVSKKGPSPREDKEVMVMSDNDIEKVIIDFKEAADRAKKAGYDGVQIHAAHGYLISQFLSDRNNAKTDSWGGNIEGKSHLLLSVYQAIRSELGSDYPILVKMNGSDDPIEGFSIEESSKVATWLADEGLDGLEISGMKSTRTIKDVSEEGYFVSAAKTIKQNLDQTTDGSMPLIVVGGNRTISKMEEIINDFSDFVSICRPFIREPDLVRKFKSGKKRADCISCSRCLKSPIIISCMAKREDQN